jgi:hypothetical protein
LFPLTSNELTPAVPISENCIGRFVLSVFLPGQTKKRSCCFLQHQVSQHLRLQYLKTASEDSCSLFFCPGKLKSAAFVSSNIKWANSCYSNIWKRHLKIRALCFSPRQTKKRSFCFL